MKRYVYAGVFGVLLILMAFYLLPISFYSEDKVQKVDSPCDFSREHMTNIKGDAEYRQFVDCVIDHFPVGSNFRKLDEILRAESYSARELSNHSFYNYLLPHYNLANYKTQILVYIDEQEKIIRVEIDPNSRNNRGDN